MFGKKIELILLFSIVLSEVIAKDEKSSLTFVIDDTGSMSNDIHQVKINANSIFRTVLNSNESQIEDFVLVTFNDPDTKMRTVTKDREDFIKELDKISVGGGIDCPEYSISGIIRGIKNSRPRSTIYVFTDASAKDYKKYPELQSLAIKKQAQVVFILTSDCCGTSGPDYQVYVKTAKLTSGHVFRLQTKTEVGEVMAFVRYNIKSRQSSILQAEVPSGNQCVSVTLDTKTNNRISIFTGESTKYEIKGPSGKIVETKPVLRKKYLAVEEIPNNESGLFTICVNSPYGVHLAVTAKSEVKFEYGFTTFQPSSLKETATRPMPDTQSFITIELTEGSLKLKTVTIIDMSGKTDKVVKKIPLAILNKEKKLYITKPQDFPTLFKLSIIGFDPESETDIIRTSPSIETLPRREVLPKAPEVEIPGDESITVKFNEPMQLTCRVSAYPKPTINWVNKESGSVLSAKIKTIEFDEFIGTLEIDKVDANATYECKAGNPSGSDFASVRIETIPIPHLDLLTKETAINVEYLSEGKMYCEVDAYPPASITWYQLNDRTPVSENENLELMKNNSVLKIRSMRLANNGSYLCEARNSHSRILRTIEVTITGVDPPFIKNKDKDTEKSIKKGDSVLIPCIVNGQPDPHVTWFKNGIPLTKSAKYRLFGDHSLKLKSVEVEDSATYTCNASNSLGNDSIAVNVNIYESVSIYVPEDTRIDTSVGATHNLQCTVKGHPIPETQWIHFSFNPEIPPKPLTKSLGSSSLELKYIQIHQEGYYTCQANNSYSTANITYEVHVNAPPTIEDIYTDPNFNAVEGDLVTIIECKVTGNPPPTIRWSHDLKWIVPGGNIYMENGILLISNIALDDAGTYICEASNGQGSAARKVYNIHVEKYPWKYPASNILIGEGNSRRVNCDVPHNTSDLLRWFKNGKLFYTGELTITDAKISDTGTYTCRVSYSTRSVSGHNNDITVGMKPSFETDIYEDAVEFLERYPVLLDCNALGYPEPRVTWWHNGDLLNVTGYYYDFDMESGSQGLYKCMAYNDFGSVERTFNIISRDCLLNIAKKPSKFQSLMLSTKLDWPRNEVKNGFISINRGESLIFVCPHRFKKFPKQYVQAFCEGESVFRIDGGVYEYSDLDCTEETKPVIERKGKSCSNVETTELIRISFRVPGGYVDAYSVCLDVENERPIYTKQLMPSSMADVDYPETKWKDDKGIFLDLNEAYDCNRQLEGISSTLGKLFHNNDGCCFDRKLLVNSKDLMAGVAQKTAFNSLNVIPHWSTCNSEFNNWNDLEERVRKLAKSSYTDLLVWTGVAGDLRVLNSTGARQNVVIRDGGSSSQSVPLYLWKVVQYPRERSSLAIIQVNVPDLTMSQAAAYRRCSNRCYEAEWMQGSNWHDVNRGYTYCCSLKDFERAFDFAGVFEPHYNLLKDVSSIPDVSLT